MMFRTSREPRGPDPHLHVRMGLFMGAAVFALAGIATQHRILIYIAIGILVVASALRFLRKR